jgi:hypothetical protein
MRSNSDKCSSSGDLNCGSNGRVETANLLFKRVPPRGCKSNIETNNCRASISSNRCSNTGWHIAARLPYIFDLMFVLALTYPVPLRESA